MTKDVLLNEIQYLLKFNIDHTDQSTLLESTHKFGLNSQKKFLSTVKSPQSNIHRFLYYRKKWYTKNYAKI